MIKTINKQQALCAAALLIGGMAATTGQAASITQATSQKKRQ